MTEKVIKKVSKKIGVIVSDKMDKTRLVLVTEKRAHAIYGKTYLVSKKIQAHDEKNEYHTGDEVEIAETKPFSKAKSWQIVRIIADKKESK